MESAKEICFAAESTLGKLAKWLRILGFDTFYKQGISSEKFFELEFKKRILLTRTERFRNRKGSKKLIFITSNNPFEQLKEVIFALGIVLEDTHPFSRCIRCNTHIKQVDKDAVQGKVPDYIWETHNTFQACSRCRRIYWPGSHTERSHDLIMRLFDRHDKL